MSIKQGFKFYLGWQLGVAILSITIILLIMFSAAIYGGLSSFSLVGLTYSKNATWQGEPVTFESKYQFGDYEIHKRYFTTTTAETTDSLTLSLRSENLGTSAIERYSNQACVSFDQLNLAQVSQVRLKGVVDLETQGYKGQKQPASLLVMVEDGLFSQTILSLSVDSGGKNGQDIQEASRRIADLNIQVTQDYYFVTDASGAQLGFSTRTPKTTERLVLCLQAGQEYKASSKATMIFSNLDYDAKEAPAASEQSQSPTSQLTDQEGEEEDDLEAIGPQEPSWFSNLWNWIKSIFGGGKNDN